ncbi:SagB family peptide dehydrogenase [Kitasatospora viridis]|uniref:SagB-type dehydrogenase family enzyme n=1 Tax=Kitasatospora viridis TaxID=281105 RepID=A0A561TVN0_9ACTN|nr:SagB family peptide dehydrogenase [Kitasatospora viridis]TWF91165.1 SagB-type dehydrogenase family enzyme [Kitasatospora viridis]
MNRGEGSVGREFLRVSLEDLAEAMEARQSEYANPDEPLKFKIYRGRPRRPLTTRVPRALREVEAFDGTALSTLLRYGYGLSRQEFDTNGTWPYHRMVASARCLFGVQLYVVLPEGVHHYDAPHHELVLLRDGDHRQLLAGATGTAGASAEAVFVLSGLFSKTAYIYRDYAYRLCTQEAGLLTGNLDLVARSMGLRAHVHHQFLDEPVDKLLGLDRDEEPALVVLALHLADADLQRDPVPRTAAALAATIDPISPTVVPSGLKVAQACPTLTKVNRASLRTDTATFAAAEPVAPAVPDTEPLPLPPVEAPQIDLAQVLRERDSGPGLFKPVASQVDGIELWARLARIRTGVTSDSVPAGAPVPLEIYLTVGDLTGIPAGCYRLDQHTGALHPVLRADADTDADTDAVTAIERVTIPGPVFRDMNAIVHLVGDRDWAFDTFGDRGYRVLNQEAGLLAHRVCVAAAAQGMSGRIVNAYHAEGVRAALGLADPRHAPLFQILLARTGPGGRVIVPVEPEGVE